MDEKDKNSKSKRLKGKYEKNRQVGRKEGLNLHDQEVECV